MELVWQRSSHCCTACRKLKAAFTLLVKVNALLKLTLPTISLLKYYLNTMMTTLEILPRSSLKDTFPQNATLRIGIKNVLQLCTVLMNKDQSQNQVRTSLRSSLITSTSSTLCPSSFLAANKPHHFNFCSVSTLSFIIALVKLV